MPHHDDEQGQEKCFVPDHLTQSLCFSYLRGDCAFLFNHDIVAQTVGLRPVQMWSSFLLRDGDKMAFRTLCKEDELPTYATAERYFLVNKPLNRGLFCQYLE